MQNSSPALFSLIFLESQPSTAPQKSRCINKWTLIRLSAGTGAVIIVIPSTHGKKGKNKKIKKKKKMMTMKEKKNQWVRRNVTQDARRESLASSAFAIQIRSAGVAAPPVPISLWRGRPIVSFLATDIFFLWQSIGNRTTTSYTRSSVKNKLWRQANCFWLIFLGGCQNDDAVERKETISIDNFPSFD